MTLDVIKMLFLKETDQNSKASDITVTSEVKLEDASRLFADNSQFQKLLRIKFSFSFS